MYIYLLNVEQDGPVLLRHPVLTMANVCVDKQRLLAQRVLRRSRRGVATMAKSHACDRKVLGSNPLLPSE